jgi:voltage-gated potassium channel Kch
MVYYLIICRSLTYAQRTAAALERAGIAAYVLRAPKSISTAGCTHCVKISQRSLSASLLALNKVGLSPQRIYVTEGDGSFREVKL